MDSGTQISWIQYLGIECPFIGSKPNGMFGSESIRLIYIFCDKLINYLSYFTLML